MLVTGSAVKSTRLCALAVSIITLFSLSPAHADATSPDPARSPYDLKLAVDLPLTLAPAHQPSRRSPAPFSLPRPRLPRAPPPLPRRPPLQAAVGRLLPPACRPGARPRPLSPRPASPPAPWSKRL